MVKEGLVTVEEVEIITYKAEKVEYLFSIKDSGGFDINQTIY